MKISELKNYAENKCAAYGAKLIDTNDDQLLRSLIQIYRNRLNTAWFLIKDNESFKLVSPKSWAVEEVSTNYDLINLLEITYSIDADILCTKSPIYATEILSPDASKLNLDFSLTRGGWRNFQIGAKAKMIKYTGQWHGAWSKRNCETLNSTVILPESDTENNDYQKVFQTMGLPPWMGLSIAGSDSFNLHDGSA